MKFKKGDIVFITSWFGMKHKAFCWTVIEITYSEAYGWYYQFKGFSESVKHVDHYGRLATEAERVLYGK